MVAPTRQEFFEKSRKAWQAIEQALAGLEGYGDWRPAPTEWSAKEVLSHLLGRQGEPPTVLLQRILQEDLPEIYLEIGQSNMTPERQRKSLGSLKGEFRRHYQEVVAYINGLSNERLQRKGRFPAFRAFMGTDQVSLIHFATLVTDLHWRDHAGQLKKIKEALAKVVPPEGVVPQKIPSPTAPEILGGPETEQVTTVAPRVGEARKLPRKPIPRKKTPAKRPARKAGPKRRAAVHPRVKAGHKSRARPSKKTRPLKARAGRKSRGPKGRKRR